MKKTKLLLATAAAFALSVAGASAAFGDRNDEGAVVTDENTPIEAVLTKVLEMPVGTELPDPPMTFTFVGKPISVDDVAADEGAHKNNRINGNGTSAFDDVLVEGDTRFEADGLEPDREVGGRAGG